MFELDTPIDEAPLVFLDVETTGLSPQYGDRVCEVAALRCVGGDILDAFQHLVNPQRPVSPGAFAVHGISEELLRQAPRFEEIAEDLQEILEGAVFVGHNAAFDLGFIASEMRLVGRDMAPTIALDTLRLARRHYRLRSYSLTMLAASLGIERHGRAHRAMVDVLLTRGVLQHIVDDLWPRGIRTVQQYQEAQGGSLRWGDLAPCDVPPIIREALALERCLYIRYRSEGGQETERLVRPLGLRQRNGLPLLLTHCMLRDAQRTFRIDRIIDVEMVEKFE